MSGHSKWATTKRQKALVDAKKGAIFTKLGNQITMAARDKGGDLDTNFTLRMAIDKAKTANMPKDNIERAIKRGTGELGGEQIVELIYEGIGPAGSQFIIKCLTDSRNRSASTVRHLFSKYGGSLGSVAWNFDLKGVVRVSQEKVSNLNMDEFELELIDAGASDIVREEEGISIFTKPEDLQLVKQFLENKKIETESAEIEYIAKEELNINDPQKESLEKFIAELDADEDISEFYHNINI